MGGYRGVIYLAWNTEFRSHITLHFLAKAGKKKKKTNLDFKLETVGHHSTSEVKLTVKRPSSIAVS